MSEANNQNLSDDALDLIDRINAKNALAELVKRDAVRQQVEMEVMRAKMRMLRLEHDMVYPRDREAVPDCLDQMAARVKDLYGEDSDTYRALRKLYNTACEEHEATPFDKEEFTEAHQCRLSGDIKAINGGAL